VVLGVLAVAAVLPSRIRRTKARDQLARRLAD
jgi:hypothetical protein